MSRTPTLEHLQDAVCRLLDSKRMGEEQSALMIMTDRLSGQVIMTQVGRKEHILEPLFLLFASEDADEVIGAVFEQLPEKRIDDLIAMLGEMKQDFIEERTQRECCLCRHYKEYANHFGKCTKHGEMLDGEEKKNDCDDYEKK